MFSPGYVEPVPPMVSIFSTVPWGWLTETICGGRPASAAYESANRGTWVSVGIPTVCVAKRMWWVNGSTVSASYNVEAGIYHDDGYKPGAKLITTGSVAQGTATQVQFADITDTTLAPGIFWLYISCSSTSATFHRSTFNSVNYYETSKFQQASIGPGSAPATATPAEAASQNLYLFGFSTTTIT